MDLGAAVRRRTVAAAAVGVALLGVVGVGVAVASDEEPATGPVVPHLPTVVNAPGTWSDRTGVDGPVAAMGLATRTTPVGLRDDRQALRPFTVSAADGLASWLRMPGFRLERTGFSGGFAVSPDGRWIGWVRAGDSPLFGRGRLSGWSVLDTTAGQVRRLGAPHTRYGMTMNDLAFSGDSRYLLTSYVDGRRDTTRHHQLVAWDVRTGRPTVVEQPGPSWLPSLGSAPSGVVWSRGSTVFRVDPATGSRTTLRLPERVAEASWGPDDRAFAWVSTAKGRDSLLHVGRDVAQARERVVRIPDVGVPQLLGWRDATHLVVGHWRTSVHVVDVGDGSFEEVAMRGYGEQVNAPYLAAGLWAQPLVAPVDPEGTSDPRRPWRWGGLLVAAAGGVVLVRRSWPLPSSA